MTYIREYVINKLFEMQDIGYKNFHKGLIPNIPEDKIIGVRTPELRKFAKELSKSDKADQFFKELPLEYYEENNLHAFLLETIDDYSELIYELERFLPFVDNWATCDMMSPKIFKKHLDKLCYEVDRLISSSYTYSVRYGINILMKYYLDEHFEQKYLDKVEKIRSDEYYINMMRAWYFATALAKQYDVTIKLFEKNVLDTWTHNKAIQKAVESNRIKADTKLYLKTLKIK